MPQDEQRELPEAWKITFCKIPLAGFISKSLKAQLCLLCPRCQFET